MDAGVLIHLLRYAMIGNNEKKPIPGGLRELCKMRRKMLCQRRKTREN